MYGTSQVVAVVALASLVVLVCRRVVTATPLQRREALPVLVSVVAWALGGAVPVCLALLGIASTQAAALPFALALLTFPSSLLVSMAVRRLQRALAVERLLQPVRMTDADAVRDALARVVQGPDLTLALWSPQDGT